MDLHNDNIMYDVSSAGVLSFKLIDFGFNKQYREEKINKKIRLILVPDVTAHFLDVCEIMTDILRDWHPVEYVMFHLCISMMLGPFCVPNTTWTLKMHIDKTNAMLKFVATTSCDDLTDFADMNMAYHAKFPNSKKEFCKVWGEIFKTYACIESILIPRWRRICCIVGMLVIKKNTKDGQITKISNPDFALFSSNNYFTEQDFFAEYLKDFRIQYYSCKNEDMSVINGEFDVFSLGVFILNYYEDKNTEIKHIIMSKLFCTKYHKSARMRLTETAEAIQRLEVLSFDLT